MPFLFIISMSSLLFCAGGKCTQNGHSVAGRGVRTECRARGPGARIPCPIDRLRRRLSAPGVCNCRLSPRTYHTGPQPPTGDLPGPRSGLDVNTPRAQGREVGHCGTRNSSQVLWTGVDSPRRTWPTPSGRREPVLFTATAAPPRWLPRVTTLSMGPGTAPVTVGLPPIPRGRPVRCAVTVDARQSAGQRPAIRQDRICGRERVCHAGLAGCRRRVPAHRAQAANCSPVTSLASGASRGSSMHLGRDVHHSVILGSDVPGYRTNPARNRKTGGDGCRATGRCDNYPGFRHRAEVETVRGASQDVIVHVPGHPVRAVARHGQAWFPAVHQRSPV